MTNVKNVIFYLLNATTDIKLGTAVLGNATAMLHHVAVFGVCKTVVVTPTRTFYCPRSGRLACTRC